MAADWAGMRIAIIAGLAFSAAACASYPREAEYSIHADRAPPARTAPPPASDEEPPVYINGVLQPRRTNPATESPPPIAAPVGEVEGGALEPPVEDRPVNTERLRAATGPAFPNPPPPASSRPMASPARPATTLNVRYVMQPGDTLSGVGRRFGTTVQTLVLLNNLGPDGRTDAGQALLLPDAAVDGGPDPYATGPSPRGVAVPDGAAPPPPPPPPAASRLAPPPAPRPTPPTSATTAAPSSVALNWPVRGDILRRFGAVAVGERNNGVNIGAAQGAEVRAAAPGRVGYVGDDLAGQGLTVLLVHADGWRTVYSHLGSESVSDGQTIAAGQVIGTVGTTAGDGRPSIHFEVWRLRGSEPQAVDPLTVLPR